MPSPATRVKSRRESPATATIERLIATITDVVPMSGSITTSAHPALTGSVQIANFFH